MKIKDNKNHYYIFYPTKDSKLINRNGFRSFTFKYKQDLITFLNNNFYESLNGEVVLVEKGFGYSITKREWVVWFNEREYENTKNSKCKNNTKSKNVNNSKGNNIKVVLKQQPFRGMKYIFKTNKISKKDKRYFAFSDKVVNLMSFIGEYTSIIDNVLVNINSENITPLYKSNCLNLVSLFYKRGFVDFVPNEEEEEYIDQVIADGINFFHWSDRCNVLRMKVIIEYFRRIGI